MKHLLKQELKKLYQAPEPVKKKNFLYNLDYPKATQIDFVLTQAGYINKVSWIISILLAFLVMFQGYRLIDQQLGYDYLWMASSCMPVLALLVIIEVLKSSMYGMEELEMSAKHNLPSILLVRMGVMAALDMVLIGMILLLIVKNGVIGYFRAAVYLLVPYLLTCVITLAVQSLKKGRDTIWYSVISGFFVCMLNMVSKFINNRYSNGFFGFWVAMLLVLVVVVLKQIINIKKEVGERSWNLYSTE